MEPTATMGLAGFDILWRGESDVGGCEGGFPLKKCNEVHHSHGPEYPPFAHV